MRSKNSGHIQNLHQYQIPFLICLLCALLIAPLAPATIAVAEPSDSSSTITQTPTSPFSGRNINSTEFDDVIAANSADEEVYDDAAAENEIIVHSGLSLRSSQAILDYFSTYSDKPFLSPATTYNHKLARMSICMATCANRPIPYSSDIVLKPDQYLVQYLQDCGFTNLREDDYDKTPSLYTVATAIGSKTIEAEGEEPFTLIAVGVCGGNYKKEWLSNVTLGLDNRHQGFDSAARIVTDRIFGYMGTHHITGRVKIWIAGFSRAAAVSNVTAANLVDSKMLNKDDIYAYTFATPRTTKDYGADGYENIFNIMGPMDVIPQVTPAAWGFGRYGNDLYLPGQETDSDFAEKYMLVQEGFRTKYQSTTNYNPKINLFLRLLIGMFEEIVTCQEEYDNEAQASILSVLENKSPQNIARVMRALTFGTKNDSPEKRQLEDGIIEFVGRVAFTEEGNSLFRNTGSIGSRIFHEHIEELYLMWLDVDLTPEELYNRPDTFTYLVTAGTPTLTVDNPSTGEVVYQFDTAYSSNENDNPASLSVEEMAKEQKIDPLIVERFHNSFSDQDYSVVVLPHDSDYRVTWEANQDEEIIAFVIPSTIAISPLREAYMRQYEVKKGDTGILYEAYGDKISATEDEEVNLPASFITWILGIDHIKDGWRAEIMQDVFLFCLILILIRAIVATINRWGSDERWQFRFLCSSVTMLALLESEVAYWLFAGTPEIRLAWKAIAGVAVLLYCICCRQKSSKWFWGLFAAILFCMAGDLAINFWFVPGVVLFALAHIFFIALFQQIRPIRKTTWMWWAIISAAAVFASTLVTKEYTDGIRIGICAYIPILLLLFMTGRNQKGNLNLGSFLFVASDCCLGLYFTHQEYPYIHMLYMVLYYLALLVMCRSLLDEEVFITKDGKWDPIRQIKNLFNKSKSNKPDEIESAIDSIGNVVTD